MDLLTASLSSPWSLVLMSLLVVGDAFFVVVPGEVAVTALGAIAVTTGSPPLWAVVLCAAVAATVVRRLRRGSFRCYVPAKFALIARVVRALPWFLYRRMRS